LGMEVEAKLKLGITPELFDNINKFDEIQGPSCSIKIKPFIALSKTDKLGLSLTLFKYKPVSKEAYLFFQAHGFDLRLLCVSSALSDFSISPITSYFIAPPSLQFKGKDYNRDSIFSYPKVSGGSTLLSDDFVTQKYLSPKIYIATPAICDTFTIAFSYSPFSLLDKTIRDDYNSYYKSTKDKEKKLDEITKAGNKEEKLKKLTSSEKQDDYSVNVINAFSIAPKFTFNFNEDTSLKIVTGLEIATEELHLFRNASSFGNRQIKTNTLVTPYIGSELKLCNVSLSAEGYVLYEPDLKENKDLSYAFSAASKVQLGKFALSIGGLFGKQMCHYLDKDTYATIAKNKRTYNFNTKLLAGIQYAPIEEVTFYIEGGVAHVHGYTNSGTAIKNNSDESKIGVALGIKIKV
jgi:hypothetical protein